MKVLAVIPARGGSKGIPKKNIIPIVGKPLIAWTIEAALESGCFERVIVSSEDDEILGQAKRYGAEVLKRPAELASDTARSEPVLTHALSTLKSEGSIPELVMYLQPTSPLRNAKHLKDALALFHEKKADALVSVSEVDNSFLKAYLTNANGFLRGVSNDDFPSINRQELPPVYMPNGAIYIVKSEDFIAKPRFHAYKTVPFVMSSEESIDLDSLDDARQIEKILKNSKA